MAPRPSTNSSNRVRGSTRSSSSQRETGSGVDMLRKTRIKSSRASAHIMSQNHHHVASAGNQMTGMQIELTRPTPITTTVATANGNNSTKKKQKKRRPSAGSKYRNQILAEVGLDDDEYSGDDDSDDDDDDSIQQHQQQQRDHKKKKPGRRRKVRLSQTLVTSSQSRNHDEEQGLNNTEDDDDDVSELLIEEDDEFNLEYESSDTSIDEEESSVSYWKTSLKRIMYKLVYVLLATILTIYIFYGDDILSSNSPNGANDGGHDNNNDEGNKHNIPQDYIEGYKDARIPDDDIAQFGGGLIGPEVFGKKSDGGTDDDDSVGDQLFDNGNSEQQQDATLGTHEHTGIAQVDLLWEQLNGYAELVTPYNPQYDLPVFWHVPKSGGTTLQDLLMHCVGMVGANEIGGTYAKDTPPLEVIHLENGNRYVNVDMASPNGIVHAKEMGFGSSGLANVVMTSWLTQTSSVFENTEYKGRCFTLLRHPIRRAVSMFYYLKDATWEHTYSEVYKNMTLEEYTTSEYAEDNWMTRFLTNTMAGGIYEEHLELAKEVLASKCLVGLMEEFTPSLKRFSSYFGYMDTEFGGSVAVKDRGACVTRVINHPDNTHAHPNVEEGSDVWNMLLAKNELDMALYEHAVHLFHDVQTQLVSG